MVSIPACHAGDRGSIPRRGAFFIGESRNKMIQTVAMKFNNGYNEDLFPVKSPVNDQSIVQMRQIIIF